ncbi:MAG TPA: chromate efflux transporter [Cyanobium sp.]|nr:chromate efflux transporter [Cyanobium sp.]
MSTSTPRVTLAAAARFWLRLGLVSFGGPAGQISLLHGELVERRHWLSERRFLHALNYCMLLPGPEAMQLATYLGWLMHGSRGGLIAGGLFLLPSVLVLLGLSAIYALWGQLPLLASVFWALKPAVLAIVLQAAWRLGRRTLHSPLLLGIALAAFLGLALLRLPYPLLIGAAALAGWIGGRLWPRMLIAPAHHGAGRTAPANPADPTLADAGESLREPIHGDATPPPTHARFCRRRLALTLLISAMALAIPMALVINSGGWNGILATMARFFTRVALLSFGGAYAVLPYVAQGAVETFGWLSTTEMIDGMALGETTPGPLIMVVAFVGFMGGWNGSGSLAFAAVAALVVVWFTFLPSFLFILAGAPLVEATRGDLRLGAPLKGITAAVVGVIASLAIWFAGPVLWHQDGFAWAAAAIVIVALVCLMLLRWSVLQVIGGAALVGVVRLLLVQG